MSNTGPLLFVAAMFGAIGFPAVIALIKNHAAYVAEKNDYQKDRFAFNGFALAVATGLGLGGFLVMLYMAFVK
ncbi:hypothetical protein SAMN05428983_0865 [Agrobacterium fabrum]|uniref:Uncharacterized protein n=1 Tax=Agrobacterium fabrum TaxID=1176649 RepID=A0A7Z7BJD9_9HYPH|nr:hypothetical protein [Agrobacterium fabrum]SDJ25970.1 hypothetical protein SAMN05428983_0865 [Agrobacterium fabrum]